MTDNQRFVGDVDEFQLIARLFPGGEPHHGTVVFGIGDDASVRQQREGWLELVTTDMLVDSVHFRLRPQHAEAIGYKSVAVNLSDIAAMGGLAHSAYLALALPPTLELSLVEALVRGIRACCDAFGVDILGGDTVASPHLALTLTVIGEVEEGQAILRNTARPGDQIFVTGSLGDSAAGLASLEQTLPSCPATEVLIGRHLRPQPQLEWGRRIGASGLAHAMLDLSDGLSSDLRHICEASDVGALIEVEALPISDELRAWGERHKVAPLALALHGGEDYQLLIVGAGNLAELEGPKGAPPLVRIGEIRSDTGIWQRAAEGAKTPLLPEGWHHFQR